MEPKERFKGKFTDTYIKNLKPTDKEYFIREGNRFTIRVRKTGLRTFFFIYTLPGEGKKNRYLNLGNYPETKLAEAREKYNKAYSMHQKGIPLVQNLFDQPTEVIPEKPFTEDELFGELCKKFLSWSEGNHSKAWKNTLDKALTKDVLPKWEHRPIKSITRRDAIKILEDVASRAPGQTANVHKAMSGVFEYAIQREYIDANPVLRMSKVVHALKYTPKDRILTEDEIRTIWNALTDSPIDRAIKLILVCAQRPVECAELPFSELSIGEGQSWCKTCSRCSWWTLPKERAEKGKRAHLIYLTPTAMSLIGNVKDGLVFGVKRNSLSQRILRSNYFNIPEWTPHDLRRTARTMMAKIGVLDEHAEAVINHAKKGVVGVYNLYEYQEEKRDVLLRWEAELLIILSKE